MQNILVTITVAVYNTEKYITNCISSIISQTYSNLDIIIIDDGSSDNSLKICRSFIIDNRIRIYTKKNEGLSSARQMGLNLAKGEYICFVDSDDYLEIYYVEELLKSIIKNDADISVCNSKYINRKIIVNICVDNSIGISEGFSKSDIESNYANISSRYLMSDSWNKIYKIEFIRKSKVGFLLPIRLNGSDLAFNYKLLLHRPKMCHVNKVLYNHLILENTAVTRKHKNLQKGFFIIISQIISESKNCNYEKEIFKQISILYYNLCLYAIIDDCCNYRYFKEKINVIDNFYFKNKNYLKKNQMLLKKLWRFKPIYLPIFIISLNYSKVFFKILIIMKDSIVKYRFSRRALL